MNESKKPNPFEFIDKMRRHMEQTVSPGTTPGELPIERIMKNREKEAVASAMSRQQPPQAQSPQQPPQPQEVIFYKNHKVGRDFFSMMTLCIIEMNDPQVDKVLEAFKFEVKDLDGKIIFPRPRVRKKKKKIRRK